MVVCGGGTSGFPAAVAAAREGAKVALIERYGFLGGVPTASIMPCWHGLSRHHSGLLTEFAQRVADFDQGPNPFENDHIEPETAKMVMLEMLIEAGVEIHLHNWLAGVTREGSRVTGVITESKSGRRVFRARAVVDTTGDGDVAAAAGADYMKGRDGKLQGMTLRFRIGHIDLARYFAWMSENRGFFRGITDERLAALKSAAAAEKAFYIGADFSPLYAEHPEIPNLPEGSYFNVSCLRPGEFSVNATRIYGVDGTVEEDLTRAEIVSRRQAYAIWRFLRRRIPGFEKSMIVDVPAQIGVRETRCILGDHVLTEEDCRANREFPDSVMTTRIAFDIHDVDRYVIETLKGVVDVPYGCFLPRGVEGITVAGRTLSCDHVANSTIRKMETAFQSGQVAGTAAALAALAGVTPRELPVSRLQAHLEKAGLYVSQEARYRQSEVVLGRRRDEPTGIVAGKNVTVHEPREAVSAA